MGEAKRRKLLDPNFGKQKRVEVSALAANSRSSLLPDFGEWYFKNHGNTRFFVQIDQPFVMFTEHEGYINFSTGTYVGTIVASVKTVLKYRKKPFVGEIQPSPGDRYFTQETCEWVLPFRIVQELENAEG